MATPEVLNENAELARHQLGLHRALRLPRRRELPVQGPQGPDPRARGEDLGVQERAGVDARVPPQGARPLPRPADARLGLAACSPRSTSTTSTTSSAPPRRPSAPGTTCPRTSRTPSTGSASPRPSASSSPASAPSTSPRSSTTRSTRSSSKQGVIFLDMDSALREHEDLVREYFATVIPANDNKFAALNSAVWSGGSFVYVPPGVEVEMPLQAYFRINTENMGQFERTLIIADEGSYVHYVEGCTAPTYSTDSLHSAVVELIAKPGARIRYTTVQNWSHERLQPRDQARGRAGGRDGRVGRLQPRLQAHHEVPVRLPDGRARRTARSSRSPSPATASTRTPAARSSTPRRTRPRTSSPSRSPRAAGAQLPRPARGRQGRPRLASPRSSATRCCSTRPSRSDTYPTIRIAEDDVNVDHEATRLQGRRRAALLPAVPRPQRGGGRAR